jgi:hypothetical protein
MEMEEACKLGDIDTVKEIVRGDPHLIWQPEGMYTVSHSE